MSPTPIFLLIALLAVIGDPTIQTSVQSSQDDAYAPLAAVPNARFEVASIKNSGPDERGIGLYIYPGARVVARGVTVRYLIAEAYRIDESQIIGGPAWIDKDRFHIEAEPSDSVASRYTTVHDPLTPPSDEIRQMLQNLLAERFQLKVHVQQNAGQIYELVRNNHPLRLSPPKDTNVLPWAGSIERGLPDGKSLKGQNISMPELATSLTEWLKCPVIDRTSLSGSYDFLAGPESDDTDLALIDGISQSLRELGLELKKNTGTIYKLAIDQVSLPSSN
jgi:uncharacterized protein (TIGR03435 family)